MRTLTAVLLLGLTLTGCVFAVGTGSHSHRAQGPYALEVSIEPGTDPGTWTCRAVVVDLPSGRSVMEPRLLGAVGQRAEVTSSDGEDRFTVSVLVEEGGKAGWNAEFTRHGRTVARQSGTIRL